MTEKDAEIARLTRERDEAVALTAGVARALVLCGVIAEADPQGGVEQALRALIAKNESVEAEAARLREALTFAQLRRANRERNEALFPADDWSLNDWMTAAAGELGEAANVLKKVRRGDYSLNGDSYGTPSAREMLANELGDVVAYLDLLADHAGVDLGTATAEKWDIISRRLGYPRLISDFAQPEPSAPCETCGGKRRVCWDAEHVPGYIEDRFGCPGDLRDAPSGEACDCRGEGVATDCPACGGGA